MPKPVCQSMVLLLLGMACLVRAGELRLDNGAILPGELVSIGTDTLVWKADRIGDISVAKSDVLALQTSQRTGVKLAPKMQISKDCLVHVAERQWSMDCEDEQPRALAFAELRSLPPASGSSGKFLTTIDIDRGTNPSDEIKLDLTARWLRPGYRHNVYASIDYEETNGDTSDDDADANYQYDVLREMGWYWFGRARYYRDKFEALNEVYAASGGIGRDFTTSDTLTMSLQGGPALMYYFYDDQGGQTEPGSNIRWTAEWQTPWHGITASHSGEIGWIFSISDAYLFQSKTGFSFPLYKGLIAELHLEYDRAGVNVGNNGDHDTEWVFALGYKW